MRSNNPVLTRTDFGASQQAGYQPQGYPGMPFEQYGQPGPFVAPARMTMDDVVNKTGITLLTVIATAMATWVLLPPSMMYAASLFGALATFVTSLIVSFRRQVNPAGVLIYAAFEGIFVGALSFTLNYMYPGIVIQAVLGTFLAAAAVLGVYRFGGVRVSSKVGRFIMIATLAYAGFALINLVLMLLGGSTNWFMYGPSAGAISWLSAGLGVLLAVGSLMMDFNEVERGIRSGAPATESWRAAFGLTVTLVWLYTNILRILSFFQQD